MLGSLAGTKAGNQVYEDCGGWAASGCLSIGVIVFSFVIIVLRGPVAKYHVIYGVQQTNTELTTE
jgi:hypothetical protein